VNHVVVEKRRRVHELDGCRERHVAVTLVRAELGGGDGEHWTQALAAGIDQVAGKLWDQLDIRSRTVEDDAVDMGHVPLDKRGQRSQARLGVTAGKLYDNSQENNSSRASFGLWADIVGGEPPRVKVWRPERLIDWGFCWQ